ncbi:hypothetical protein E2562_016917 [Oryza meyeriana var. granulata]|uniref:Uncharacterized protein n=1 Tax=Oryza meyeriana var. granulata TaxID=110450 RepID=A0A6G1DXI0_9ORYZ|nr:hypothetical protein E2562_016917 [Oryza meyeriana var. granulata]
MESAGSDYRHIDGIYIAHGGHHRHDSFCYGEGSVDHDRKLEETWANFNVHGLTSHYFLPPCDLRKDAE